MSPWIPSSDRSGPVARPSRSTAVRSSCAVRGVAAAATTSSRRRANEASSSRRPRISHPNRSTGTAVAARTSAARRSRDDERRRAHGAHPHGEAIGVEGQDVVSGRRRGPDVDRQRSARVGAVHADDRRDSLERARRRAVEPLPPEREGREAGSRRTREYPGSRSAPPRPIEAVISARHRDTTGSCLFRAGDRSPARCCIPMPVRLDSADGACHRSQAQRFGSDSGVRSRRTVTD